MPAVSFDSKSFLLPSGRGASTRFPIVAASFDATLIDPASWAAELARLRHAGFNTVVMRVPWLMHEPTPGRFVFEGACDVRRAVVEAGAAGLKVALRIGPCVGGTFARGGLPGWIGEFAGDRVREAQPAFLARVTGFWRALAPQFVDLQYSRNGIGKGGVVRPVIAVGIEDDWRCLDATVGEAYFSALVRFAREVGIDVPLFSANNCWYMHDGMIDAWRGPGAGTARELREVQPDSPPMVLIEADGSNGSGGSSGSGEACAREVAELVCDRADFVVDAVAIRHVDATSAAARAEIGAMDVFPLRRALVFASTFAAILAEMQPSAKEPSVLVGRGKERVEVAIDGDNAGADFEFIASDITIDGSRLERCSGSLVALDGDLVVVAGKPRGKISVQVDGSAAALTVAAEGAAPKVVKVRGLRFVAVPHELAAGVGIAVDGREFAFDFVDATGAVLVRVARDGTVTRSKTDEPKNKRAPAASTPITLAPPTMLAETGFIDGSHARFASTAAPRDLGEFGVRSRVAYYRARAKGKAAATALLAHAAGVTRVERTAAKSGALTVVAEVRDVGASTTGVFGPLLDVAPLKGVKCEQVMRPAFDATTTGRFVYGYDMRDSTQQVHTLRWTFAPRTDAVVVRVPEWWRAMAAEFGCTLRLNGELVAGLDTRVWPEHIMLDGAKLSPMRPVKVAKGEKPPKAKLAKLEPGANELLLDLGVEFDGLAKLRKDIELLAVRGEVAAEWAFARVSPPASWAGAKAVAKTAAKKPAAKPTGVPTWFRTTFRTTFRADEPRALELACTLAAGEVAMVFVNGASTIAQDGASGVADGKKRERRVRHATLPASLIRAGDNEICVFTPDGVMPAIEVR